MTEGEPIAWILRFFATSLSSSLDNGETFEIGQKLQVHHHPNHHFSRQALLADLNWSGM